MLLIIFTKQFVPSKLAKIYLKSGEMEKSKCYRALCWCPQGGLNAKLMGNMNQYSKTHDEYVWPPRLAQSHSESFGQYHFGPIRLSQATPIRVLHRRSLTNRIRSIHSISFASYEAVMKSNLPEVCFILCISNAQYLFKANKIIVLNEAMQVGYGKFIYVFTITNKPIYVCEIF